MTLELINWDLVGGEILKLTARTREVVVEDASLPVPKDASGAPRVVVGPTGKAVRVTQPAGDHFHLTIERASIDPEVWSAMLSSFADLETSILGVAEAEHAALQTDGKRLADQINAAEAARAELATLKEEIARKRDELAAAEEGR